MARPLHCSSKLTYTQYMSSLSQVTHTTRKLLEYGALGLGAIVVIMLLVNVVTIIKNVIAPTPPTPPTVRFGKVPAIDFPNSGVTTTTIAYSLNTLTGSLPVFPDRMNVYKFESPTSNLLALDKATSMATAVGFLDAPTPLSDTMYQWTKTDPLPSTLAINTQSYDYNLTSSYATADAVMNATFLPDTQTAQKAAQDFLASLSPLSSSIDTSKTKTSLFTLSNGTLTPASSLAKAQIIRVDFFFHDIDQVPVYLPNPSSSFIYALIASGETSEPQVVEAEYLNKDLSSQKATYPIISSQQAYEDLKSGKAFIAANPSNQASVSITNVSLGYFMSSTPQDFLEPIVVFSGNNGFVAYVPAVKSEWLK